MDFTSNRDFKNAAKINKSIRPALRKVSVGPVTVTADRCIKFIFSSGVMDRDFDCIDQAGIDVASFLTNPVIFFAHDHDSMPIGKCISIGIEGGNLVGVIEFVPATLPVVGEKAEAIYQLCKLGFLNCVSIGFITRTWSYAEDPERYQNDGADITSCELVEVSIVGIPSNREAMIQEIGTSDDVDRTVQGADVTPVLMDAPAAKRYRAARLRRLLDLID
jgi:HK97 family phage prohead protease